MSTLQCCCCEVQVKPVQFVYGVQVPIVGAQVDIFWNKATKGAFLDPVFNDSSQGPYTTTADGVTISVNDADNHVYLIRIIKAGMATRYLFSWLCGASCADARLGTGRAFLTGAPVPTGASLTTNLGTVRLTDGATTWAGTRSLPGTSWAPISGAPAAWAAPGVPGYTGGTFPLLSATAVSGCVPGSTGSPGYVTVGCTTGGAGIAVVANIGYTVCPLPSDPVGSVETATHYAGVSSANAPATLSGKVTGIEYSPLRITGSWDLGTWSDGAAGGIHNWRVSTPPPPGLIPLSGDFVIE